MDKEKKSLLSSNNNISNSYGTTSSSSRNSGNTGSPGAVDQMQKTEGYTTVKHLIGSINNADAEGDNEDDDQNNGQGNDQSGQAGYDADQGVPDSEYDAESYYNSVLRAPFLRGGDLPSNSNSGSVPSTYLSGMPLRGAALENALQLQADLQRREDAEEEALEQREKNKSDNGKKKDVISQVL